MKTLNRLAIVVLIFVVHSGGAKGQTLTTLYSFSGLDGRRPSAGLVQGSDGDFYGTTLEGGTSNWGTVFRITPGGSYTNLYILGTSPDDGKNPFAGLVRGSDGNFYGTTTKGGTSNWGTVFRITPSGSYTNLYSFVGYPNASYSEAELVLGSDGNFYGTTTFGGTNNNGTIFRISPTGNYTNLYSFAGNPDGALPETRLVEGGDGNFYGTTTYGGTSTNYFLGCGIVFRISPSGDFTNLHSFNGADGFKPIAGLVQGGDGYFYGTTREGGTGNTGTVFRISSSGDFTNLYSFVGSPTDGGSPDAALVQGSDGNFYGTTFYGGTNPTGGTVFRISPSGSQTILHSFAGYPNDGQGSTAGLVQGSDGTFYGTTQSGGIHGTFGTVFALIVPLNPPANQISAVQIVGNDVAIAIPSVAGETYQLQFSADLASGIWSNVPDASVTNSIGAMLTLTNFGGALQPQGFYRFTITP